MLLWMKRNFFCMASTGQLAEVQTLNKMFDDFQAQIGRYCCNFKLDIRTKFINRRWLVGIDQRLDVVPQQIVQRRQIARPRRPTDCNISWDNTFSKIDCDIRCVACGAVLLEPHVLQVHIIQLGRKILGYHWTVAIPIHSNVPVLIITAEEVRPNEAAGP